jgi:ABC-2 type transport system ATP-binding protein
MRRTRFAFAPPALFETMSAREHLVHLAALGGSEPTAADVERTLETVGLEERADEPVRGFSFGMRQRLGLAQALLPLPELLVLDEPAEGLDPLAVLELREVLRRLREREGIAILLSSHLLVEVDRLVDELLVLTEGRTLFRGAPAELRSGSERLVLETDEAEAAAGALRERGHEPLEVAGGRIVLEAGAVELEEAAGILREAGTRLHGYQHVRPTLEEALLARLRAAGGRG